MNSSMRKILVTGAHGFIGKNLVLRLNELPNNLVTSFVRGDDVDCLPQLVAQSNFVVHLAAENRPVDEAAFEHVNAGLTSMVCDAIEREFYSTGRHVPLVLTSSIQADCDNPYGLSKLAAERAIKRLVEKTDNPSVIFRLPGVFGKWCKPNYNSVVATFCYNLARNLPIQVHDPSTALRLVYVDDVISALLEVMDSPFLGCVHATVKPEYNTTLGEIADKIIAFDNCRATLITERVGSGFQRALYATYVSYLPEEKFSYKIQKHSDSRGVFVEMLKTKDSGQFSYFTAHPGITRGGHYHHTKIEKFLVIQGEALFRFRHVQTDELLELTVDGSIAKVVETIPGWTHDITNIGNDELIVMLWANENFDPEKPDTVASKV
ncbi:NAD-dependent epimerase/dehydratase family protein [Paracoccaceae bacterium]|nr:NAD-dependent epimerase/dehydratase family protein [Paracoccaceae bacterium]